MNSKGVILLEFAVCMPVLIILLFYINDLVRIKRYYSQTEFVAQQMTNILQNISQKRTNKKIKKEDVMYAYGLATLTMYPGISRYGNGKGHQLVHSPRIFLHYIEGLAYGKASHVWYCQVYSSRNSTTPSKVQWHIQSPSGNNGAISVNIIKNASPTQIYPSLKISEGEIKIIVEAMMRYDDSSYTDENGNIVSPSKKAFGLHLVNPKMYGSCSFHTSVVTFTPKPGLFDETGPQ